MPFLSVILPHNRPGGLDIAFTGLAAQTFRDFELVLSDALYSYRHQVVADQARRHGIQVRHITPIGNLHPVHSFARSMNTAFAHAQGEVVVITADYLFMPPDCLARHAEHHRQAVNNRRGYMGPHTYYVSPAFAELPLIKDDQYSVTTSHQQASDYADYRDVMWSIFRKPITSDFRAFCQPSWELGAVDGKMGMQTGLIPPYMLHCKNESVRLEHVLAINGFDEDYNGAQGWQDTEFAERLSKMGIDWWLDRDNVVYGIAVKDVLPRAKKVKPLFANRTLWELKKAAGYPPVNDWSISEYRSKLITGDMDTAVGP